MPDAILADNVTFPPDEVTLNLNPEVSPPKSGVELSVKVAAELFHVAITVPNLVAPVPFEI